MKRYAHNELKTDGQDRLVFNNSPMAIYLAMAFQAVLKTSCTTRQDVQLLMPGVSVPLMTGLNIAHPRFMRTASVCEKLHAFAPEVMGLPAIGGPLAAYQRGKLQPSDFNPVLLSIVTAPIQSTLMTGKNITQIRFNNFMAFCGLSPFEPPKYHYKYVKPAPVYSLLEAIAQEILIQDGILRSPAIFKDKANTRELIKNQGAQLAMETPDVIESHFLACAKGLLYMIAGHAREPVAQLRKIIQKAEKTASGVPTLPTSKRAYWLLRYHT